MMKIRVVKTGSKANAVQIVRYKNNKRIIVHHLGSSHTEEGLKELKVLAQDWITNYSSQLSIFPDESPNKLLHINHINLISHRYSLR